MPDETKPDATRPAFRLRAALAVPAGWPPDVAPNQIITAAHINSIKSSVYAWPGDVDGQNHTLSNVHLANATGVLADPTLAAGDLIARDAAAIGRFPVGAAGQVLTVDLALPQKLKWATPAAAPVLSFNTRTGAVLPAGGDYTAAMVGAIPTTLLTTKGDLIAFGTVAGRMPAGSDGQILRADSASTPFGLRWGSESVPSVFGRSGAPVVAQAGDYTASQVTNAVSTIATYPDPAWITSLSWAKLIGVPASFTPAAHTHDAAAIVSGVLATARLGTGVANNTVYLRGDGTWAAAGTGGGGGVVSVFGRAGTVIAQAGDYTPAMVGAIPDNLLTSTGDLLVRNNVNQTTRLPIGANGQVLQTDLATSVGMKWTTISASVQTPWVTNIDASNFDLVNVHRLGVALAVPNYPVDVIGDINYTGVLRSNGVPVVFGGSQTPWTQNINASGFSLNNAGTVGIGVTAPQSAPIQVATHTPGIAGSVAVQDLDATTAGNPVLLVTGLGSEGTRAWAVGCRGGATYGKDLYVWNDRSSDMLFGTNSAERMRITAAGNVGIGNAAAVMPSSLPSVRLLVGTTGAGGSTGAVVVGGNVTAVPSQIGEIDFANYALGGTEKRSAIIIAATDSIGAYDNAYMGFYTMYAGTPSERMRITAAGNVGIGTASPGKLLEIHSTATSAIVAAFNADDGVATNIAMAGIGLGRNSAQPWGIIYGQQGAAGTYSEGNLLFYTQGSSAFNERMRITNTGNVGIGTASPQASLHITRPDGNYGLKMESTGSVHTYGIAVSGSGSLTFDDVTAGAIRLFIAAGGNVGLGTGGPSYKLDVAGDVNCSGAFRVGGAAIAQIVNRLDAGTPAFNQAFQNTFGKPSFVSITATIQAGQSIQLKTDAGNPPASVICSASNAAGVPIGGTVSGWVLPGNYYQVYTTGATVVSWFVWY